MSETKGDTPLTFGKMVAVIVLKLVCWIPRILGIFAGLLVDEWYTPLVWLMFETFYINLVLGTEVVLSRFTRRPSKTEDEIARKLWKDLLSNPHATMIPFALNPRYSRKRVHEWIARHLPAVVKDRYKLMMYPVSWNILPMLMTGGYRFGVMTRVIELETLKGIIFDVAVPIVAVLAYLGPQQEIP